MNLFEDSWIQLASGVRRAQRCIANADVTSQCDPVWHVIVVTIIAIGILGVLVIARIVLRDYLRHRRAIARWFAEQEVAPPEIMEELKWKGERAVADESLSQAEIAARIKLELQRRKQPNG
jgi:hypothetical protein